MDVAALLLIEPRRTVSAIENQSADLLAACANNTAPALLPVLGRALLFRIIESLALTGVRRFEIISSLPPTDAAVVSAKRDIENGFQDCVQWHQTDADEFWMCAEDRMEEAFSRRTQAVIVLRAESYFELGSASALASCCALPIAHIVGKQTELDAFWITAAARAQGSDLLRAHMRQHNLAKSYSATYANPLQSAADLRRLTNDAFQLRLAFRPAGRELRPGVWVGEHATIHRTARVVAPAYIGDYSKVRAAALVTRCSSIEHHCEVDCGTVVQSSNLLPNTYLGAGLELLHCVAGEKHIANAAKARTALIGDSRLLDQNSGAATLRVMKAAGRLASYLPAQIVRGVAGTLRKQPAQSAPDIGKTAIATSLPASAETALAAGLATTRVTRDHGNE